MPYDDRGRFVHYGIDHTHSEIEVGMKYPRLALILAASLGAIFARYLDMRQDKKIKALETRTDRNARAYNLHHTRNHPSDKYEEFI